MSTTATSQAPPPARPLPRGAESHSQPPSRSTPETARAATTDPSSAVVVPSMRAAGAGAADREPRATPPAPKRSPPTEARRTSFLRASSAPTAADAATVSPRTSLVETVPTSDASGTPRRESYPAAARARAGT